MKLVRLALVVVSVFASVITYFQPSVQAQAPANLLANQRTLQIVAHEDDDIIFMNPDVTNTIAQGNFERTVYLTAGNLAAGGSDTSYWQNREAGALAGHAKMAGRNISQFVPGGTGSQDIRSIYTKTTTALAGGFYEDVWTLNGTTQAGQVSVTFLRLPASAGAINAYPSVDLWTGNVNQLTTVGAINGANQTYTKNQLIQLLSAIMADYNPTLIRTQDATNAWTWSNDDHVMAGRFAVEAFNGYRASHDAAAFEMYRDYNVASGQSGDTAEPVNVSSTDMATKQAVLNAYCAYDPPTGGAGCYAGNWGPRQYSTQYISSYKGELRSGSEGNERCLTDGTFMVSLGSCNGSASQAWTIAASGRLIGSSGKCVTIANPSNPVASLADCNSATRWLFGEDGFMVGSGGSVLVEASSTLKLDDLYHFQLASNHTNAYGAVTPDGGNIPGSAAPSAPNAPLSPTALRWTFHTRSSYLASFGQQFSDATGWNGSNTYYGTIKLADVNGNGVADVCGRSSVGIVCGLNDGNGHFGNATTWTTGYSNTAGWSAPQYGTTVQFPDINGDGNADVCGRGVDGIDCALGDPAQQRFLTVQHVSFGNDFSNAYGWNSNVSYYGSIRFADVNGDGFVDVCGRGGGGISCGLNDGNGHFGAAGDWITFEFSDGAGWSAPQYGTTMQFADVNGDGKADVCGRGLSGVVCGLSTGNAFSRVNLWSFRNDFSNALGWDASQSYYGSIRLADINGDGKADVCGRAQTGIRCGYSTGSHFSVATTLFDSDFTNPAGYQAVQYGSTLQFGVLSADAKSGLCMRGISGVMCSQPY